MLNEAIKDQLHSQNNILNETTIHFLGALPEHYGSRLRPWNIVGVRKPVTDLAELNLELAGHQGLRR